MLHNPAANISIIREAMNVACCGLEDDSPSFSSLSSLMSTYKVEESESSDGELFVRQDNDKSTLADRREFRRRMDNSTRRYRGPS